MCLACLRIINIKLQYPEDKTSKMNAKKHPIDNYKKFLLNRSTSNTAFVEFVENTVAAEDPIANYTFHKIMVHSWTGSNDALFDAITEYFGPMLIPVEVLRQRDITTFYTSNLNLILRVTRLEFMFPYDCNMFNIDVLFNDKSAVELFGNDTTIEDIVSGVVSQRFCEKTLDLSDFSNDQEFKEKNICFYKLSLLANFKLLMLRMAKETKSLNLSHNQLVQPPLDIMNFFIKGDLTEINLSYNQIGSISDLLRVISKIEKLWVEGNPLCENLDPSDYIKSVTMKFPRLTELDGIKLNEHGIRFPFVRHFLENPTKHVKMMLEKFLTIYFSHFDSSPRQNSIEGFYDDNCTLTITTGFTDAEKYWLTSQSFLQQTRNLLAKNQDKQIYKTKSVVMAILNSLPKTKHDPTTFTVDLLKHNKKTMLLVIDGIFKDLDVAENKKNKYRFRRTFLFHLYKHNNFTTVYKIVNEMFFIAYPTKQQIDKSFQTAIRDMNTFELINPEPEERETLIRMFSQISNLKKDECERRLSARNWDIKAALNVLVSDVQSKHIDDTMFLEDDDFSDTSSIIDEEMVD